MAAILGLNCKMYYLTTGTRAAWPGTGAPSNLTEMTNVRDVTTNLQADEADVTTRGNAGFKAMISTLKAGEISFEMIWDETDAAFAALRTAFFANTSIAVAALDGVKTVAGVTGLWADFAVTNFSREENLADAVKAKVTIKTTFSAVAPAWVTVVAA